MRKGDIVWISAFLFISALYIIPPMSNWMRDRTIELPYLMGFLKTAVLASMGEILVARIKNGYYRKTIGFWLKALVWGILGMCFVLVFPLFNQGVIAAINLKLLFGSEESLLVVAIWTSIWMNILFAPSFMLLHRITDGWIHLADGTIKKLTKVSFQDVIKNIDYAHFFTFTIGKTIPLFWIPAHTITFLLPSEYRVLMAAYLSIVLGVLLSFKKENKNECKNNS